MKCNPRSIPERGLSAEKLQLDNISHLFLNGELLPREWLKKVPQHIADPQYVEG
jgi:hypothetical protein